MTNSTAVLTPIQVAVQIVLGAYTEQLEFLTVSEADVLRDVIAARLARDYRVDISELTGCNETRTTG
jgi:hypothetical protein